MCYYPEDICFGFFIQSIITGIGSIIMVICGGVFWGRLNFDPKLLSMVSLPLTPSTDNPRDIYIVSNLTNQSIFCDNKFSINYPGVSGSSFFSFYIIHNMFSYDIKITIDGENVNNFNVSFNTNRENLTIIEYQNFEDLKIDSSPLRAGEYFRAWCPSSSLITQYNDIDQLCSTSEYPMKFDSKYTISYIGGATLSQTQNILEFYNSTFIPNNYIEIPEVFLANIINYDKDYTWEIVTIVGVVAFPLSLIEGLLIFCCVLL